MHMFVMPDCGGDFWLVEDECVLSDFNSVNFAQPPKQNYYKNALL